MLWVKPEMQIHAEGLEPFLMSEHLNRPAIDTARKLGVICTRTTGRSHMCNTVAAYEHEIDQVINRAITFGHLVIAIIDDYTTIHSHRRSDSEKT